MVLSEEPVVPAVDSLLFLVVSGISPRADDDIFRQIIQHFRAVFFGAHQIIPDHDGDRRVDRLDFVIPPAQILPRQFGGGFAGLDAAAAAIAVNHLVVADVEEARPVMFDDVAQCSVQNLVRLRFLRTVRGLMSRQVHVIVVDIDRCSGQDRSFGEPAQLPRGVVRREGSAGDARHNFVIPAFRINRLAVGGRDDDRHFLGADDVALREIDRIDGKRDRSLGNPDSFRAIRILVDHSISPAAALDQRNDFDIALRGQPEELFGFGAVVRRGVEPPVACGIPRRFDDAHIDFEPGELVEEGGSLPGHAVDNPPALSRPVADDD